MYLRFRVELKIRKLGRKGLLVLPYIVNVLRLWNKNMTIWHIKDFLFEISFFLFRVHFRLFHLLVFCFCFFSHFFFFFLKKIFFFFFFFSVKKYYDSLFLECFPAILGTLAPIQHWVTYVIYVEGLCEKRRAFGLIIISKKLLILNFLR